MFRSALPSARYVRLTSSVLSCCREAALSTSKRYATPNASSEDRDDLERERQLRERFAEKVSSMNFQGKEPQQVMSAPNMFNEQQQRKPRGLMWFAFLLLSFFFFTSLFIEPAVSSLNRMHWHEAPLLTVVYYSLMQIICSRSQQASIKSAFEAASIQSPNLTFDQFVTVQYPSLFAGNETTQQEIVAAVGACFSGEDSIAFLRTMSKAVGFSSDTKKSVDRCMAALRKGYPQYFS